jgi:hypothetical protein
MQEHAGNAGCRKGLRRRLLTAALAVLLVTAGSGPFGPGPVQAGDEFCAGDPIFTIDGEFVQIVVQMPRASRHLVHWSNPMVITVLVPQGADVKLVSTSGSIPERVEFLPALPANPGLVSEVHFSIFAPDQGDETRYTVRYTASSRLDFKAGHLMSGDDGAGGSSLRVPMRGRIGSPSRSS